MTGNLPPIVVMGVSAAGKSAVGTRVAARLGVAFVDADDLHPASNVAKMSAGVPLDDDDRWPWLDAVAARLAQGSVVIACSALKRAYRDRLRQSAPATLFVLLSGTETVLAERAAHRHGHFMPPSLLRSQLDTLEALGTDEAGFTVDVTPAVSVVVGDVVARLS